MRVLHIHVNENPPMIIGMCRLYFMALAILTRRRCIERFKLDTERLRGFLLTIEAQYRNNPYHNAIHAADVLQTNHYFLLHALHEDDHAFPIFSALIAALCHDCDHTGFNNDYLIRSKSRIAIVYNDISCQENHHLATSFTSLSRPEYNFIHLLSSEQQTTFRQIIIDLVSNHPRPCQRATFREIAAGHTPLTTLSMSLLRQIITTRSVITRPAPTGPGHRYETAQPGTFGFPSQACLGCSTRQVRRWYDHADPQTRVEMCRYLAYHQGESTACNMD